MTGLMYSASYENQQIDVFEDQNSYFVLLIGAASVRIHYFKLTTIRTGIEHITAGPSTGTDVGAPLAEVPLQRRNTTAATVSASVRAPGIGNVIDLVWDPFWHNTNSLIYHPTPKTRPVLDSTVASFRVAGPVQFGDTSTSATIIWEEF